MAATTTCTLNEDGKTYTLQFTQGKTTVFHFDTYKNAPVDGVYSGDLADLSLYSVRGMGRAKYGTITASPMIYPIYGTVADGRISCTILPSDSAVISTATSGVFDIEIYSETDPDIVYEVVRGTWSMLQEATV
jgi:hypothetical protein